MAGGSTHCCNIAQVDADRLFTKVFRGNFVQYKMYIFKKQIGCDQKNLVVIGPKNGTVITNAFDQF